jgi:hypothetical protein
LQVPTSWLLRKYDSVLDYLGYLQRQQLLHFVMESEQRPMSPEAIAAQRYWPSPMEEQLVITAGQMAMLKVLKEELQAGDPLHFMPPVDRGLDALRAAMNYVNLGNFRGDRTCAWRPVVDEP